MLGNRVVNRVLFLSCLSAVLAVITVESRAQSLTGYKMPTKEMKLESKNLERVVSAKTVAVLVSSVPLMTKEGKEVIISYRGGRVGPEKAKADVEKALAEWGAFGLIDDPSQADIVLMIEEETIRGNMLSEGTPRLKQTLVVFPTGGPGAAPPLWVGIVTENALMAKHRRTADAKEVVERFRRDVETAKNRVKN
jgi:hypothetical protein